MFLKKKLASRFIIQESEKKGLEGRVDGHTSMDCAVMPLEVRENGAKGSLDVNNNGIKKQK